MSSDLRTVTLNHSKGLPLKVPYLPIALYRYALVNVDRLRFDVAYNVQTIPKT